MFVNFFGLKFGTSTKIKLGKDLFERARKASEVAGYATVHEFVRYMLEKELAHSAADEADGTTTGSE